MAKPEPWRLIRETYPYEQSVTTRFQDLDTMGHINNVALAAMFETGRIGFHHHIGRHPQDQGVRWLIASVMLNYVQEAHFSAEIIVASGLGHVGNSSWIIMSAAFQHDVCIATCDTVMVAHGPEGRRRIHDDLRAAMEPHRVRQA